MQDYSHLIYQLNEQNLDSIPYHCNNVGIERLLGSGFPLHLAVHHINNIQDTPPVYVAPHKHETPELNLILAPKGELTYKIKIGLHDYNVESPAAVWIPRELVHSANVISGSGYFVCIILSDTYKVLED